MKNLSVTEKYALFILKEKCQLNDITFFPFLLSSMIIDMQNAGCVDIIESGDLFTALQVVPTEKAPKLPYSKHIYKIINTSKDDVYFGDITLGVIQVIDSIKILAKELKDIGVVNQNDKVEDEAFSEVLKEVRHAILSGEKLSADMELLLTLLEISGFLNNVVNAYEVDSLKRIKKHLFATRTYRKVSFISLYRSHLMSSLV